ncbi:MAG: PhzF family phenazine biosynthesis protein [Sulfurimonas sp.]|jgi:PhzF family phenazine biosynthesis protein
MKLKIYQIDAFAKNVFEGNSAAVVPLESWLDDTVMQKIAMENNLSETVFFVQEGEKYNIRWFTPLSEVDICGHATLASAFVLFELLNYQNDEILFDSKSGALRVKKENDTFVMDFPSQEISACGVPHAISEAFELQPKECYKSMDYLLVFENEEDILSAKPNFSSLKNIDARGVIITSKSKEYDFVCRFFAPKYGIDEDPVTGSAFTQLVPYWSKVLGKNELKAKQVSQRGGEVFCKLNSDRVEIAGYGVKYLEGVIEI